MVRCPYESVCAGLDQSGPLVAGAAERSKETLKVFEKDFNSRKIYYSISPDFIIMNVTARYSQGLKLISSLNLLKINAKDVELRVYAMLRRSH